MVRFVTILACLILSSLQADAQGKRAALVIGNSAYIHAGPLTNPRNDAADMIAALKERDFEVLEGLDLDKVAFDRKVRDFARALTNAEVGVFFYAGHGLQVAGKNYLVPTDAELGTPEALDFEMIQLDIVQRIMERQVPTNILFLDACRNNPLARNLARAMGTRSAEIGTGLAPMESGVGTLISFSTQPGNVALDGTGRNSPYAGALVNYVRHSSDSLSDLLIAVRNDVRKETHNKQVPWEHSALTGRFFFGGAASQKMTEAQRTWPWVKDTVSRELLEEFIKEFTGTPFGDMASARLEELKRQQVAMVEPAAPVAPEVFPESTPPRLGCDSRMMRVVGGNAAKARDWPGHAVLRVRSEKDKSALYICGASAIKRDWVVTAAHCVNDIRADLIKSFPSKSGKETSGVLEVVIGAEDLSAISEDQVFSVEKIIVREGYLEPSVSGNDIALIKLKRPYVGPVARVSLASNTDPQNPPGARLGVAGFGSMQYLAATNTYRTAAGGQYYAGSQRFLETFLPIVATGLCKARYSKANIDAGQICAGFESGGRDSCQGDAGGQLVAFDGRGCPYQVGILSWGAGCAGARDYSVNTRISYHASWLEEQVGPLSKVTYEDLKVPVTLQEQNVWRARTALEDALPDVAGHVRVGLLRGNRVRLGGGLVFTVSSDITGRLFVFDINPSRELTVILPNAYTTTIAAGEEINVPGSGYGFKGFTATEPAGKGLLVALVAPTDFSLQGIAADKASFFPVDHPVDLLDGVVQSVTSTIARRREGRSPAPGWAIGLVEYEIVK